MPMGLQAAPQALLHHHRRNMVDTREPVETEEPGKDRCKATPLSSIVESDWHAWRDQFQVTCQLNEWSHKRSHREAAMAMQLEAKLLTLHVTTGDHDQARPMEELLDEYKIRFTSFIDRAVERYARKREREKEVKEEKRQNEPSQKPGEETLQWHDRATEWFREQQPLLTNQETWEYPEMRELFFRGLNRFDIKPP